MTTKTVQVPSYFPMTYVYHMLPSFATDKLISTHIELSQKVQNMHILIQISRKISATGGYHHCYHLPILIWVYPRKQGWPDLPHSNSNLFPLPLSISLDGFHPFIMT